MRSINTADDLTESGGPHGAAVESLRPDEALRSSLLPAGTFHYEVALDRLTWSDSLFQLYGFDVGQIVPTLSLMARHQDPADVQEWLQAIAAAVGEGTSSTLWHRVRTVRNRPRTLITVIQPALTDGRITVVSGTSSDLSDRLRQEYAAELTTAIERSSQSRGLIERAKGVLMGSMDLDDQQAFDVLRWHSSFTNTKLREVCASLIGLLSDPGHAHLPPRQRVTAVLAGLGTPRPEPVSIRIGPWTEQSSVPDQPDGGAVSRIPADQLPATLVRAVAAAAVSISIADCSRPGWPLVYVNAAFERLTGYRQSQTLGRNCRFLQGAETDRAQTTAIRRALDAGEEVRTVLRNYRQDGTPFWNELRLSAVRDVDGVITHYIGYQNDVSEREERERQLEHLAYHDPLTGLPNQAAALRHLADHLAENSGADLGAFIVRLGSTSDGQPAEPSTPAPSGPAGAQVAGDDGPTVREHGAHQDGPAGGLDRQDGQDDEFGVVPGAPGASGSLHEFSRALREGTADPFFLAQLGPDTVLVASPEPADMVEARIRAALRAVVPRAGGGLRAHVGYARYPEHAADPHELLDAARRRSRQLDHSADPGLPGVGR